jgi:hypothetical protein
MIATRPTATTRPARRAAVLGILVLALVTALGMVLGSSAEAKKKHKKSAGVFRATVSPNSAIPDNPATGPSTPLRSTITIGKKFKGKVVADVNVTGIQTTGSGAGAANDLVMKLSGPSGRTAYLIGKGIGDVSIGPLTLDDDSPVSICDETTLVCIDPSQTLLQPFAGTANLLFLGDRASGGLKTFRGVAMRGTWTFTIFDQDNPGTTSVLNSWGLEITAAKPVT